MVYMFSGCESLKSIDLSCFKGSKLDSMGGMFEGCSALKRVYVSKAWNLKNLKTDYWTSAGAVFKGCKKLVGGAGTKYSAKHTNRKYARIDKKGKPGYFTLKK